jgi:hypothetical protein
MDETLKSLRTVHATLVVTTAGDYFGHDHIPSGRRSEQALQKIQRLKNLSWTQYADSSLNALDKSLRPRALKEAQSEYHSNFPRKGQSTLGLFSLSAGSRRLTRRRSQLFSRSRIYDTCMAKGFSTH